MEPLLVYDRSFEQYRFGPGHPLRPERFALAVALIELWGLLTPGVAELRPAPGLASDADLALIHTPSLIDAVKRASIDPHDIDGTHGIGPGDTPAFRGMHEAAALSVASTCAAVDAVLSGETSRAFSPAGGMHHAHRDRVAGFCIYNDCAVGIERAVRSHAGLRVAYVDIDAHHGDGVQEAFYERPDVLTVSVHESGRYLYPGTGFARDIGEADGTGFALNVPLPPGAGRDQYLLVMDQVVAPAIRAFAPDLMVLQLGADSHFSDPLTQLGQTVAGFVDVIDSLIDIAETSSSGRMVATGGGGYTPFDATPRMWAAAFARLADAPVPDTLPESWLAHARDLGGESAPTETQTFAGEYELTDAAREDVALQTQRAIAQVREASPLLG